MPNSVIGYQALTAPSPRARRTCASATKPLTTADAPARNLTEAQFQAQVVELAQRCGWTHIYHTHDSRRSQAGFPDLCMVRGDRVIFAELKANCGRLRPEQREWLAALTDAGQEAYLWFPVSWARIESALR